MPDTLPVIMLTKRRQFIHMSAKGTSRAARSVVLQYLPTVENADTIHVGYTVSKRACPLAVGRNRIKRRLRAAFQELASAGDWPQGMFVIIGRRDALDAPYSQLLQDLRYCLRKLCRNAP